MIRTVLIDDDKNSRDTVKKYAKSIAHLSILGEAEDVNEGIRLINTIKPDLVFLDIEMPHKNGFDLLDHFPDRNFVTVIISAFDQYGVKAVKASAIDYLVKPYNSSEFALAVRKAQDMLEWHSGKMNEDEENYHIETWQDRIIISTEKGKRAVYLADILFLKSDGGYTFFHMVDNSKFITSKSIRFYEMALPSDRFFRVHKSYLVNYNYVEIIPSGRGGWIKMPNNEQVQISVRKIAGLRKWLREGRDMLNPRPKSRINLSLR